MSLRRIEKVVLCVPILFSAFERFTISLNLRTDTSKVRKHIWLSDPTTRILILKTFFRREIFVAVKICK
jgi:hypothetical protein